MTEKSNDKAGQIELPSDAPEKPQFPTLSIDYELYQHYLDHADLTEEQKREFLETLWNIIVSFVDLGFGVHPLQQATSKSDEIACGQNAVSADCLPPFPGDMVDLSQKSTSQFNTAADGQSGPSNEGSRK